ncbi:MAG: DCC1-like thiol-disulfide oxidoreductase family protein [Planctomycetota bacterium]
MVTSTAQPAARDLPDEADIVFYDGGCGLCHRWVKRLLRYDPDGSKFVYAPLAGETFARAVPEETRAELPDSIIVQTPGGGLLMKSDAVLHLMRRMGGVWRLLSAVGRCVPRGLRDFGYDRVAAVRHRVFRKPSEACPLVPADLRERFRT